MEKTGWKEMCEVCKKETTHIVVGLKPGHDPTGLQESIKIECKECGFSFWT